MWSEFECIQKFTSLLCSMYVNKIVKTLMAFLFTSLKVSVHKVVWERSIVLHKNKYLFRIYMCMVLSGDANDTMNNFMQ